MTRVRRHCRAEGQRFNRRPTCFASKQVRVTDSAKKQRVRGEKDPRTLVRYVACSPRAHGISVTLSGIAVLPARPRTCNSHRVHNVRTQEIASSRCIKPSRQPGVSNGGVDVI